jgi:hypothetical protein
VDSIAALHVPEDGGPEPVSWPTPAPPPVAVALSQPDLPPASLPADPVAVVPLRWRGVEITQGVQVFNEPEHPRCQPDPAQPDHIFCNNSMPMVAGRHTMVRVYPACADNCPAGDITIQLRLFKNGQEQAVLTRPLGADTLRRISALAMVDLRAGLDNSVNFEFFPPPAWLSDDVSFEVTALGGATAEPLAVAKSFDVRKLLRVAYLPIQTQGLTPPDPASMEYWLLRMMPVPGVEYYRLPVPDVVLATDANKSAILNKLLFTYWLYAQYQPKAQWPDQLFGWLPQEFFNGGVSDPFWCPACSGPHSSRVAFGGWRPEQDIGGPRILVHEIAHNLGAMHAWSPTNQEDALCFKAEGANIQVDPTWPYADTPHIQEFGVDLYSQPPVVYPPAYYDMMAYCARPWISPHTYRKLFDSPFLQPDVSAVLPLADFKPQTEADSNGTLLVSGVVYPDGTVSQPEIVRLQGDGLSAPAGFAPPSGGDYCLEARAADGSLLAAHCFEVGFTDIETGQPTDSSPFFVTLPAAAGEQIDSITVSKNETPLAVVTASSAPPEVRLTYPNGGPIPPGRQTITWAAADADGDPLRFDLLYSPDNGQSWLPLATGLRDPQYVFDTGQIPASAAALFRVLATDGLHTAVDQSDAPVTLEPPPENSLSLRGPAVVQPGQPFQVHVLANGLTHPGLYGVQFTLNFDSALVQVQRVQLHPDLTLIAANAIDNASGQVHVIASRQGAVAALTGDATLATLTFAAAGPPGELLLNMADVVAGGRGGLRLDFTAIQALTLTVAD